MIAILAIDALEYDKVEEFGCENLKQESYGKTDISAFSQPRTMVLWSSFMTGENKESEVLIDGNKEMWNKVWPAEQTFFADFGKPVVLDLPGFSYDLDAHAESSRLLKAFFEAKTDDEKKKIREQYNKDAFEHHRKVKEQFLKALEEEHQLVLGYFSVADVIGHLNFGNNTLMKMIYKEFDEIAGNIRKKDVTLLVISDHGMESIGMFGDHSDHGFWSLNRKIELDSPTPMDFGSIIKKLAKEGDTHE